MKKLFSLLLIWAAIFGILTASPNFPVLTDRVVDTAEILTPREKSTLISKLKAHETNTSNQIVVVTLKDLGGYDIADYGYQLGRHWGIGQKGKDNGVLLILSKDDRKVRIEVGYGLEGALPDARAHHIIQTKIIPAFKQEKFYKGIDQGVNTIFASISGEYTVTTKRSSIRISDVMFFLYMLAHMIWFMGLPNMKNEDMTKRLFISTASSAIAGVMTWFEFDSLFFSLILAGIIFLVTFFYNEKESSYYDYGSSSSGSSGGFSGFGGSFGGGGASGSW
jgi:uncharacterized protein